MANVMFNGEDLGDFTALPAKSQEALLSRVTGHFNNEAASARISWAKGKMAEAVGNGAKATDISTSDARNYTDANAEAAAKFVTDWFTAKRQQILDGTLGVRAAGPGIDPLQATMHRIAKQEIAALVGTSFPRKDKDTYVGAGGRTYVGKAGADEMAQVWLAGIDTQGKFGKPGEANHGRIERLAKREIAAKQAKAALVIGEGDESPV